MLFLIDQSALVFFIMIGIFVAFVIGFAIGVSRKEGSRKQPPYQEPPRLIVAIGSAAPTTEITPGTIVRIPGQALHLVKNVYVEGEEVEWTLSDSKDALLVTMPVLIKKNTFMYGDESKRRTSDILVYGHKEGVPAVLRVVYAIEFDGRNLSSQ